MLIKDLNNIKSMTSGDNILLKEVLKKSNDKVDINYSIAHAVVKPGHSSLKHKMKSSEVYIITKGKGIMHIDKEQKEVKEGNIVFIPPNAVQFIENKSKEDLVFICIVEPEWKKEDEEILS